MDEIDDLFDVELGQEMRSPSNAMALMDEKWVQAVNPEP